MKDDKEILRLQRLNLETGEYEDFGLLVHDDFSLTRSVSEEWLEPEKAEGNRKTRRRLEAIARKQRS